MFDAMRWLYDLHVGRPRAEERSEQTPGLWKLVVNRMIGSLIHTRVVASEVIELVKESVTTICTC